MGNIDSRTARILSIGVGIALCFLVAWQQRTIADFHPSSGKTARGFIKDYLGMAYGDGRGADAAKLYFAPDAVDHAADAIDRANGAPIPHKIEQIISDGMLVAVRHRIAATRGAPAMEVVDIYQGDRFSQISERWRVVHRLDNAQASVTPR